MITTEQPKTFFCSDCHQDKPIQKDGGTGYAELAEDGQLKRICYQCAAERDKCDMIATGKAVLYLTTIGHAWNAPGFRDCTVSNWPGTLKFKGRYRSGHHNIARVRYDVWFTGPNGESWHGTQYGENTQLTHCKRIKSK